MNTVSKAVRMLALAGAVLFPAAALADDSDGKGWFVEAGSPFKNFYGGVRGGMGFSNFPNSNQDGSVTGVQSDGTDVVRSVFLGYQIMDYVAVEGSFNDFGQTDFRGTSSGGPSWAAGPVRATDDLKTWEVGVWGRWPIAPRWYAIGFLGASFWESNETYYEVGPTITMNNESGSSFVYALGFEWDVGLEDRFVYRFTGSQRRVDKSGYEVNTLMAELVYRVP